MAYWDEEKQEYHVEQVYSQEYHFDNRQDRCFYWLKIAEEEYYLEGYVNEKYSILTIIYRNSKGVDNMILFRKQIYTDPILDDSEMEF